MAADILILDFQRERIAAGLFNKGASEAERTASASIGDGGDTAALEAVLGELRSGGNGSFGTVVLGIRPSDLSLRQIDAPFTDARKIAEILPMELSESLLKEPEDLLFSSLTLDDGKILGAACEKAVLQGYGETLSACGLSADIVTSSLFSKDRLLSGRSGTAAFVDGRSFVAARAGKGILFKEITSSSDIGLAIGSLAEDGIEISDFYATGLGAELLGSDLAPKESSHSDEESGLSSLAAAMTGGGLPPLDFPLGGVKRVGLAEAIARGTKLAMLFLILFGVMWGGHIYLKTKTVKVEADHIKNSMNEEYLKLFPGEGAVVSDPVYLLEAKLKALRNDGDAVSGIDVLGLMKAVSELNGSAKAGDIRLDSLNARERKVRLSGFALSKDSYELFKKSLLARSGFEEASFTTTGGGSEGSKTAFTVEFVISGPF